MPEYDAIILGTGQGGNPLAMALANAGWQTAVVEQKHVGGSCINYGCTPTKAMVASARAAYDAKRAPELGVEVSDFGVHLSKVVKRKADIVKNFRDSGYNSLKDAEHLDLFLGKAHFVDRHQVQVDLNDGGTKTLTADRIFINTGAKPVIPPISGLDDVDYLDSTALMELQEIPNHLIVLGGGYVGLEFGQMFRRFGSEVTILQRSDQLLPREDKDVADNIASILQEDGITIHLNSEAASVSKTNDGLRVTAQQKDKAFDVTGSHLLVAVGRTANTDELHLQAAGVDTDKRGNILVNERLETNVPGIYALGDVKPGPMFTHISYDDFRVLHANLLEDGNASISGRMVPYVVFTDPQLGRVGLTEKQAQTEGTSVRVAKLPMAHVARGIETGETRGFLKVVVDQASDTILGCAMLAAEGGELMSMIQIAMMGNLPYTRLQNAILAHPTYAEALNNVFFTLE